MEIARIEIPNYVRKIQLSEARNPKYFERGKSKKIPVKYKDLDKYDWLPSIVTRNYKKVMVDFLCEISTGERLIANPKAAGTPKYHVINGQTLHRLTLNKHTRSKIVKAIKAQFTKYINYMKPIKEFPIVIELEIHDLFNNSLSTKDQAWDVDNRALWYNKIFQDLLVDYKKIPGDSVRFITGAAGAKFIPVDTELDIKLVFIIKKETDPRVLNHEQYK